MSHKIDKETIAEYISIFFDKEFNDFQDKFSRTWQKNLLIFTTIEHDVLSILIQFSDQKMIRV